MALFKRKDKDGKRKGENAIGKIIYGFLLFMPLIAVGVACLYAILNKNAFESYSDYKIQDIVLMEGGEQLIEGQKYEVSYKGGLYTGNTYEVQNGNTNIVELYFPNETWTVKNFNPSYEGTRTRLIVYDTNNTQHNAFNWQEIQPNFYFYADTNTTIPTSQQTYNISYYILVNGTIDQVFYYQLGKLEESDLFNWTKNTGAYTVMHNVTEGIGITNTYTPMLMTYWLLISVIYFIFDIALILVWAVHDKIHELKDAI